MVRNIPTDENPCNHPVISLSLLIASIAATIAIVSSLCGTLFGRKSPPSKPTAKTKENKNHEIVSPTNQPNATTTEIEEKNDSPSEPPNENGVPQLLPPPPGMSHLRAASYHVRSSSNVSVGGKGKLASSMSMRVNGGGLIGLRQMSKREDNDKKKDHKKLKHEDSIWKKTIILGGKCKVLEDEEDTIVYDEKGKQVQTYHKKAPASISLSRQSSSIDPQAVPS